MLSVGVVYEGKRTNLFQRTMNVRAVNKLFGNKIFRRVGAMVMVAALFVSLSACNFNDTTTPTPGPGTSDVCDDCGGNHRRPC